MRSGQNILTCQFLFLYYCAKLIMNKLHQFKPYFFTLIYWASKHTHQYSLFTVLNEETSEMTLPTFVYVMNLIPFADFPLNLTQLPTLIPGQSFPLPSQPLTVSRMIPPWL